MKVGVVGSRSFSDYVLMVGVLDRMLEPGDVIVSGGAEGADSLAVEYARASRPEYGSLVHHPDTRRYGWPRAAFERNSLIVEDSDLLLAFFGPGQPPSVNISGTMDTVRKAIAKRIEVRMYFEEDTE